MKKKAIWSIVLALVVVGVCLGILFNKRQQALPVKQNKQNAVGLSIKKNEHNNQNDNPESEQPSSSDEYSTDEWMLMGYMAYAHDNYVQSRHIKNNAELVDDVQEDLSDGDLTADKKSNTTYTLTNKFGSVDVEVEDDDVKVTDDGTTVNSKSELKEKFASYSDEIKGMTKSIKNGGNDNSTKDSKGSSNSEKSGNKDSASTSSNESIPNFSVKQLAVLAGFYRGGDESWVTDCINKTAKTKDFTVPTGTMCYGYNKKTGDYFIDGHGDDTTIVDFRREGNVLITKHNDMTGSSVDSSPMVTKKVPLSKLIAKYYSTPQQKAKVDDLANKLLDQQQYHAKVNAASKGEN